MKAVGRRKGGRGIGKAGTRRHRIVCSETIKGITKPVIQRLARRGKLIPIISSMYAKNVKIKVVLNVSQVRSLSKFEIL